jgi:hypothetical protein
VVRAILDPKIALNLPQKEKWTTNPAKKKDAVKGQPHPVLAGQNEKSSPPPAIP